MATGRGPAVGDVYQRVTREFAVEDSFERVVAMFGPVSDGSVPNGHNGSAGSADAGAVVALSVEQLHRCRNTQGDLENFVQAVLMAVTADQENPRPPSGEGGRAMPPEEADS